MLLENYSSYIVLIILSVYFPFLWIGRTTKEAKIRFHKSVRYKFIRTIMACIVSMCFFVQGDITEGILLSFGGIIFSILWYLNACEVTYLMSKEIPFQNEATQEKIKKYIASKMFHSKIQSVLFATMALLAFCVLLL